MAQTREQKRAWWVKFYSDPAKKEEYRKRSREWAKKYRERKRATDAAWYAKHKEYAREQSRIYRAKHPDLKQNRDLKYAFGITLDDYKRLLEKQNGKCAICGTTDSCAPRPGSRFAVDHDHTCCPSIRGCGKCIRGLLCGKCNKAIGLFADSPERLRNAAIYLERSKSCLLTEC